MSDEIELFSIPKSHGGFSNVSSGTFDASTFDRFLSENCAKPDWVIITGTSKEDVIATLKSIFPSSDYKEYVENIDRFKWVEVVEGSWEEVDENADSS